MTPGGGERVNDKQLLTDCASALEQAAALAALFLLPALAACSETPAETEAAAPSVSTPSSRISVTRLQVSVETICRTTSVSKAWITLPSSSL